VDTTWASTEQELRTVLADLPWGGFIIVEYDRATLGDDCPFSQAAPGPAGWYAEVVSDYYLPTDKWPIDEDWLVTANWLPPDGETRNWWRDQIPLTNVACELLEGLAHGRRCADPGLITARVGHFPSGPRGGEPVRVTQSGDRIAA